MMGFLRIRLHLDADHDYLPYLLKVHALPPALECTTTSESVSKLLFKLNEARRFFIEADSSNRIKRALKSNVRYDNGPFVLGDRVFFNRDSDDRWKGAAIIGLDGAVVYVRQRGKVC